MNSRDSGRPRTLKRDRVPFGSWAGQNLRRIRIERSFTIESLSAATGYSHMSIWKIEKGYIHLYLGTARVFSDALRVTIGELVQKPGRVEWVNRRYAE